MDLWKCFPPKKEAGSSDINMFQLPVPQPADVVFDAPSSYLSSPFEVFRTYEYVLLSYEHLVQPTQQKLYKYQKKYTKTAVHFSL